MICNNYILYRNTHPQMIIFKKKGFKRFMVYMKYFGCRDAVGQRLTVNDHGCDLHLEEAFISSHISEAY